MLTLNDGRADLWQWDTGRILTVKIYVPKGSAEAYKAAAGWSNMKSLILEEPDEKT